MARPFLTLLDVVLVAFFLYRLYVLLSRTRALQLLVGFSVILLAEAMARYLKLETVSWIITNLSSYLVFGLIVLLQPELRRLLAEIGKMPIFRWLNPAVHVPLDEIIVAVRNMAQSRTGSIIVLLRKIKPETILDNAVKLESAITSELIETIFFKDTPLHDGALFIEGNRILAASCYLPLTQSKQLKKSLGARHRAAMGFSEESDALIIVTSEETGKISVMMNGEHYFGVKAQELKSLIHRLLEMKEHPLVEPSPTEQKTPPAFTDEPPSKKGGDP